MILDASNIIGMKCFYEDEVECLVTNVYFQMEDKFPYTCAACVEIVPVMDDADLSFDWHEETQNGVALDKLIFR